MKRMTVDCSKPIGHQETVSEITGDELEYLLQQSAVAEQKQLEQPVKNMEDRITALEELLSKET